MIGSDFLNLALLAGWFAAGVRREAVTMSDPAAGAGGSGHRRQAAGAGSAHAVAGGVWRRRAHHCHCRDRRAGRLLQGVFGRRDTDRTQHAKPARLGQPRGDGNSGATGAKEFVGARKKTQLIDNLGYLPEMRRGDTLLGRRHDK
ncbi:hypothetical protein PVW47_06265 [Marinovum sp. SP66]|uniref:hypothetical protein n=1 Tax=Marinovum TaxID=367771 RepID=UPI00237BDD3B|nr:hypothetical protein [Marinovum sp. SP66]MDD9739374.1 hypothetical protein [Marinovum sp. SP66]